MIFMLDFVCLVIVSNYRQWYYYFLKECVVVFSKLPISDITLYHRNTGEKNSIFTDRYSIHLFRICKMAYSVYVIKTY